MRIHFLPLVILVAVVPLGCGKTKAPASGASAATASGAAPDNSGEAPAIAPFTSDKHGFSVGFPAKPKVVTKKVPANLGGTIEDFVVDAGAVQYLALPMKLPQAEAKEDLKTYFDRVQKGEMIGTADSQGKVVSSHDVTAGGHT